MRRRRYKNGGEADGGVVVGMDGLANVDVDVVVVVAAIAILDLEPSS